MSLRAYFLLELSCFSSSIVFFFEGVAEIILKTQRKTSLQCIAARIVNKYDIPYAGVVPKNLENFIELHGISKCFRSTNLVRVYVVSKCYLNCAEVIIDKMSTQMEPPHKGKVK